MKDKHGKILDRLKKGAKKLINSNSREEISCPKDPYAPLPEEIIKQGQEFNKLFTHSQHPATKGNTIKAVADSIKKNGSILEDITAKYTPKQIEASSWVLIAMSYYFQRNFSKKC